MIKPVKPIKHIKHTENPSIKLNPIKIGISRKSTPLDSTPLDSTPSDSGHALGHASGARMTKALELVLGDSIEGMRGLSDGTVDMVFADPPYNLQLRGELYRPDDSRVDGVDDDWDRVGSFADYDAFSREWASQARRILKPNGTLWVIGSYHNIYRLGSVLLDLGFWILNDIVWIKSNPMPNFRGRRFTNAHETLLWCAPSEKASYRFNYRSLKAGNDDLQMRSDWYMPICSGSERLRDAQGRSIHPTQKPLALLRRIISSCTDVGDLIVDPFLGSGTTAVAAKQLHRRCIGFERDPIYHAAAQHRCNETQPLDVNVMHSVPEPRRLPRIPFGALVDQGMVNPGTALQSICRQHKAVVQSDGSLRLGQHQGSIHQIGAVASGKTSCNGWTYWTIADAGHSVPIAAIRERMTVSPDPTSSAASAASAASAVISHTVSDTVG